MRELVREVALRDRIDLEIRAEPDRQNARRRRRLRRSGERQHRDGEEKAPQQAPFHSRKDSIWEGARTLAAEEGSCDPGRRVAFL